MMKPPKPLFGVAKKDDGPCELLSSEILNIDLTSIIQGTAIDKKGNYILGTMPSVDTLDSRGFTSYRLTEASARQGAADNEPRMDSTLDINDLGPILPRKKVVKKSKIEERKTQTNQRSLSRKRSKPRVVS